MSYLASYIIESDRAGFCFQKQVLPVELVSGWSYLCYLWDTSIVCPNEMQSTPKILSIKS